MDIVKFKREQEQHRLHIQRIRETTAVLDSTTPESLGLQHLAIRPKKQQLIEDRRQAVAKENAKLMGLMTKIMSEKRSQPNYVRPTSLNEVERKRSVDRVNQENRLISERLRRVPPVISTKSMAEDFEKHLKAEANLRRRQMKPMGLPKDFMQNGSCSGSPVRGSLFDSSTYTAQQTYYPGGNASFNASTSFAPQSAEDSLYASPIRSMTEFRRHVIASKKQNGSGSFAALPRGSAGSAASFEMSHAPR